MTLRSAFSARRTVVEAVKVGFCEMPGIGLLNEKELHSSLKQWYSRPGDRLEVTVDGFVIDIVRNDLLIEIQTANFASIKSKLINLARSHRVRLDVQNHAVAWLLCRRFGRQERRQTIGQSYLPIQGIMAGIDLSVGNRVTLRK